MCQLGEQYMKTDLSTANVNDEYNTTLDRDMTGWKVGSVMKIVNHHDLNDKERLSNFYSSFQYWG